MEAGNILYLFITVLLAVISFFLVRFFFVVDEIRKDVKDLLVRKAAADEITKGIADDVDDLEKRVRVLEQNRFGTIQTKMG